MNPAVIISLLVVILLVTMVIGVLTDMSIASNTTIKTENDELKRDYDALLQRANELAKKNTEANALAASARGYLVRVGEQVKTVLNILSIMRRGHELLVTYKSGQHGEHTCCPCFLDVQRYAKGIIDQTTGGLTLSGTMDELSRRLTQSVPVDPEAARALRDAGGVVADNRSAHVDLSGQLKNIKITWNPHHLTGAPITVAARRLETEKLVVDLVKHENGKSGIAIITADDDSNPTIGAVEIITDEGSDSTSTPKKE